MVAEAKLKTMCYKCKHKGHWSRECPEMKSVPDVTSIQEPKIELKTAAVDTEQITATVEQCMTRFLDQHLSGNP